MNLLTLIGAATIVLVAHNSDTTVPHFKYHPPSRHDTSQGGNRLVGVLANCKLETIAFSEQANTPANDFLLPTPDLDHYRTTAGCYKYSSVLAQMHDKHN
jgi:hypothetical protein